MSQTRKVNAWNVDLYIVTWNVSSKYPDASPLTNLLGLEKKPANDTHQPDFYIIGLQEVNAQPQNMVLGFFKDDPWTQRFKEILKDRDYVAVKSEQMQGMLLIVFAKRKHILHLRQIESEYTRTGLGGIWGNKGAISIRLNVYGTAVSIVNAHLAAHDHMLNERIVDYNQILDNHHYHVKMYREIFDHDYVFWFGDLNFRLEVDDDVTPQEIRGLIENDKWADLLKRDQLNLVRKEGKAFYQLEERLPAFPPTFKFERGTSNYDMKRRPAWCDRILYKVRADAYQNVNLTVEQTSYKSHPGYTISDHKPVTSEFVIKFVDMSSKPSSSENSMQRKMNREASSSDAITTNRIFQDPSRYIVEFDHIAEWTVDTTNIIEYTLPAGYIERPGSDWIAMFRHDFNDLGTYIAYEYVPNYASSESKIFSANNMPIYSDANEPRKRRIALDFSEHGINIVEGGKYVLLYFEREKSGVIGVAGISNSFVAKKSNAPVEIKSKY